jgi:hypothetical protein
VTGEPSDDLPPRLVDEKGPSGELLRRFARSRPAPDPAPAWERLLPRLARPDPRARLRIVLLASVLGAVAGSMLVLVLRPGQPPAPPPVAVIPVAPATAPPLPAPRRATGAIPVALGVSMRPLPVGQLDLGEVRARVAGGTTARGRTTAAGVELELLDGQLGLEVAPQLGGRRVEVTVRPYRFVVLGTRFQLEREGTSVRLAVEEGKVAVHRETRLLSVVAAGESWTPPVRTAVARPPDLLAHELAAYELGRARRDRGDLAGALAAFRDCRRRFPRGPLRPEVDLSIVELLPRLGRFQEALDESAAFLAAHPRGERTAELRRLRGNIYRDGLKDPVGAQREYELAGRAP